MVVRDALERNADLFPEAAVQRILAPPSIDGKLAELFVHARNHDIPLYVLIDEYDNFANTILASRGPKAYESFTHGGGFFRSFFATLKAGAGESGGGIERLFITGVSPITMDDVTSGFNIGANISLEPDFNEMLGFTDSEVRGLLELYRERDAFGDRDNFLSLLYYFGLLSVRGSTHGRTRLGIPNQTVRRLLYGQLRGAWKDVGAFSADQYVFSNLVVAMAYEGKWRPAVEYLRDAIAAQTVIRHRRNSCGHRRNAPSPGVFRRDEARVVRRYTVCPRLFSCSLA